MPISARRLQSPRGDSIFTSTPTPTAQFPTRSPFTMACHSKGGLESQELADGERWFIQLLLLWHKKVVRQRWKEKKCALSDERWSDLRFFRVFCNRFPPFSHFRGSQMFNFILRRSLIGISSWLMFSVLGTAFHTRCVFGPHVYSCCGAST